MKPLLILLSFCTFAYGFLLPGYLTLKDPQPDPDQIEVHRKRESPPEEVQAVMNILMRQLLTKRFQQAMPFPWQDLPKLNTGVFTPEAWLRTNVL